MNEAKTLNELYSLSDKVTGKEMWEMIYRDKSKNENIEIVTQKTNESFLRYIDPFTNKVRGDYSMLDINVLCVVQIILNLYLINMDLIFINVTIVI